MKDDKTPKLKWTKINGVDICDFFECHKNCTKCRYMCVKSYEKWQEQCKDKQSIAVGTAKTKNSKAMTV